MNPLDDLVNAALTGPHAAFAQSRGRALRYAPDVAPWAVTPGDDAGWADLAALAGPSGGALLAGEPVEPGPGWTVRQRIPGVQLDGSAVTGVPDPDAVVLGAADVPEMLELVRRTRPGPFLPRTHELGLYLGIREGGALVAMAGERMRLPGWTEISAVCTDPAYRGKGLAARLVRAVVAAVRERGERAFLHTGADNLAAIRVYAALGFTHRRDLEFAALAAPVN